MAVLSAGPAQAHGTHRDDNFVYAGTVTTNEQRIGNSISHTEGIPYPGGC